MESSRWNAVSVLLRWVSNWGAAGWETLKVKQLAMKGWPFQVCLTRLKLERSLPIPEFLVRLSCLLFQEKKCLSLFFGLIHCSVERCFLGSIQTSSFSSTSSSAVSLPVFSTSPVFTSFTGSNNVTSLLVNTAAPFILGKDIWSTVQVDFCEPGENESKQASRWERWPQWWSLNMILELWESSLSVPAELIREEKISKSS